MGILPNRKFILLFLHSETMNLVFPKHQDISSSPFVPHFKQRNRKTFLSSTDILDSQVTTDTDCLTVPNIERYDYTENNRFREITNNDNVKSIRPRVPPFATFFKKNIPRAIGSSLEFIDDAKMTVLIALYIWLRILRKL